MSKKRPNRKAVQQLCQKYTKEQIEQELRRRRQAAIEEHKQREYFKKRKDGK